MILELKAPFVGGGDVIRHAPDGSMVVEYRGTLMRAYPFFDESKEVISFYIGSVQVGQITRSLAAGKGDAVYFLHFLDVYDSWEGVLTGFVAAYQREHDRRKKPGNDDLAQVLMSSQNRDYYHRDFIRTCFGEEESLRLDLEMEERAKQMAEVMKTEAVKVGLPMIAGCALILAALLTAVWFLGL